MVRNEPLSLTEIVRAKPLAAFEPDNAASYGAQDLPGRGVLTAKDVDRRLRTALHRLQLAERNAVLWFGEVFRRKLFRELGFSSIYQYAGEALGFSRPRTAQFIRLCESLEELPALKRSVAAGDVSWTKAREVAKVATAQTETAWVEVARRESRRKLERRVRMAQTRGRARRRNGGRQLGLGDQDIARADSPGANGAGSLGANSDAASGGSAGDPLGADPDDSPGASPTSSPGASAAGTSCAWSARGDAEAWLPDGASAEVPVTLSVRFTPEQYARYEAILEKLRKRGDRAPREELILAGLEALLVEDGSAEASAVSPRNPKAANRVPVYQIVVQQCEDCGRARVQTSRGVKPIDPATAEAMRCDARVLRSGERTRLGKKTRPGEGACRGDEASSRERTRPGEGACHGERAASRESTRPGEGACHGDEASSRERTRPGGKSRLGKEDRLCENPHPGETSCPNEENRVPARNRATIPPAVRRKVLARDGHRCRAPGCGAARFLEVHHVVSRAEGGSNRPDNLLTLCSACHRLAHAHARHGDALARAPAG